ncbi:MAG: hypothetical protein AB202_00380 [Parcubacteria bacterium C7867-007]|nr:MAG: hypothetical protein AB202_00380 [Parcubacteria bacterium C7867-007]
MIEIEHGFISFKGLEVLPNTKIYLDPEPQGRAFRTGRVGRPRKSEVLHPPHFYMSFVVECNGQTERIEHEELIPFTFFPLTHDVCICITYRSQTVFFALSISKKQSLKVKGEEDIFLEVALSWEQAKNFFQVIR